MKTFIRLLSLCCTLLASAYCYSGQSPLIIAVGKDSFPFQYKNDMGKADGYLVDLWKAWSDSTGQPVKFVVTTWPQSLELVKTGKADIHAGMAKTPSRTSDFIFSEPLVEAATYLYVHRLADHVQAANDLKGYTIGVVRDSAHNSFISKVISDASYREFSSRAELLDAAADGEILIFAGLDGYLRERSRQDDIESLFSFENRIKISEAALQPAVNKSSVSLKKMIDEGFQRLSQETQQRIKHSWLGFGKHLSGISVALPNNNEPFSDVGANAIPHGFYIDLWRAWSQSADTDVNFIFYDGESGLEALKEGDIEVVIGHFEFSADDKLANAWKINQVKHRLFLRKKKAPPSENTENLLIGAISGSGYLSKIKQRLPSAELRLFDNADNMLQACTDGKLDGFIAPAASAQHRLVVKDIWSAFYQIPDIEFIEPIYAVIQKENPGLQRKLVEGFNQLAYSKLADIEKKWVLNPADRVHLISDTILSLSADQIDYLDKLPELKLGYLKNWKPVEFRDSEGNFNGINYEVIEHIREHLKLRFKAVAYDNWPALLNALKNGDVDIAGSVAKSNLREKDIVFTRAYWPTSWAIVSRFEHAGLFSLNQLLTLKIAVVKGYDVKDKLIAKSPSVKILEVDDTKTGVEAVVDGNADVFINKLITLASLVKNEGYHDLNLSLLPEISTQQSHFGVNPEYKELVPLLNIAITQLDQSKKQEIYLRWIPDANLSEHYRYRRWFSYMTGILAIVLLSFITYWQMNRKVQKERVKRHRVEERIQYLNTHDNLTGLLNRRLLDDRLTSAVLTHSREQTRFAVMFIGLDNFKLVNEIKGYQSGDKLLIGVANALAGTIRRSDTLARFGNDEFVLVLNRAQEFDAVCQVAENALAALNRVMEAQVPDIHVTASIGIAFYPMDADNPIELLRQADKLMRVAKENPESSYMTS